MVTKDDMGTVELKSVGEYNMSNWHITQMIDTLTIVNNKFDILYRINGLLNDGVNKRNIFITDKSFLITTNYKTYFEKGNEIKNEYHSLVKATYIGRYITLEKNEEIININVLFSYYKSISSLINRSLKCKLHRMYLHESYELLFESGLEAACERLTKAAKQQVQEVYSRHLTLDNKKQQDLLTRIDKESQKIERLEVKYRKQGNESIEEFVRLFNSLDRPIIGIYDEKRHSFEIINYDQIYKNGEESPNRIQLKSVSKNSPVVFGLLITGVMLSVIGYLAYRDHQVNNEEIEENMLNMPSSSVDAIRNVYGNENGSPVENEVKEGEKQVDEKVLELAESNFSKLEQILNKRKIEISIKTEVNVKI